MFKTKLKDLEFCGLWFSDVGRRLRRFLRAESSRRLVALFRDFGVRGFGVQGLGNPKPETLSNGQPESEGGEVQRDQPRGRCRPRGRRALHPQAQESWRWGVEF